MGLEGTGAADDDVGEDARIERNMTVGFVGLGNQGGPIAQRIKAAGWPLHVWARRAATIAPFLAAGASPQSSPLDLGASCDLVGICVANDDDVRDVVLRGGAGVLYGMKPGSILAIHSTVAPKTVVELDGLARYRGVHVLDAPVSGGERRARAGTMTIMVGGEGEPLGRATPVFESFASKIAHLGGVGSGQLMKLLNNNLCFANMAMSIHALNVAERLGMDRHVVADVIRVSSGASSAFDIVTDDVMLRKASGPTSNLGKDCGHFADILEREGLSDDPLIAVSATAAQLVSDCAQRMTGQPT